MSMANVLWEQEDWASVRMTEWISESHQEKFMWENGKKHITLLSQSPGIAAFPMPVREGGALGYSSKAAVYAVVAPPEIYKGSDGREPFKWRMALKILDCRKAGIKIAEARNEVETMAPLVHPHIISYIASYDSLNSLGIIMYPAARYNLEKYMEPISEHLEAQEDAGNFGLLNADLEKRRYKLFGFLGCISQALCYLHRSQNEELDEQNWGIKHKDIKPENILVDDFDSPILADFGIAHKYLPRDEAIESTGKTKKTEKYAPPEAFQPNVTREGYRYDVFSLGCVFLEILTVALGVSLKQMNDFRAPDYEDEPYAQTITETNQWLSEELPKKARERAKSRAGDQARMVESGLAVLPAIARMMSSVQGDRQQSHELWESFKDLYQYPDWKQPCTPCNKQHLKREIRSRNHSRHPTRGTQVEPQPGTELARESLRDIPLECSQPTIVLQKTDTAQSNRALNQKASHEDIAAEQHVTPKAQPNEEQQLAQVTAKLETYLKVPNMPQDRQGIDSLVPSGSDSMRTRRSDDQRTLPTVNTPSGPKVIYYDSLTAEISIRRTSEIENFITTQYPITIPWGGWIRVRDRNGRLFAEIELSRFPRVRDRIRIMTGRINKIYVLGSEDP